MGSTSRRLIERFACWSLAVAVVLSSMSLPAAAQTPPDPDPDDPPPAVVEGDLSTCPPEPWVVDPNDNSLCVALGVLPCPGHPLEDGRPLGYSSLTRNLCEEEYDQAIDSDAYDACVAFSENPDADPGFMVTVNEASKVCTVRHTAECPSGDSGPALIRVADQECRGYQRRSWTCPDTHPIPRNEFGSCFRLETFDASPHAHSRACRSSVRCDARTTWATTSCAHRA